MHTCDMVNIDWGVNDDDEIYQVPDIISDTLTPIWVLFDLVLSQLSIH